MLKIVNNKKQTLEKNELSNNNNFNEQLEQIIYKYINIHNNVRIKVNFKNLSSKIYRRQVFEAIH
ncbi:IS3 family transposase [Staphylococcus epidermidis]|nr:IS3 family transposase [Staphylococcus epidermidis]MBM6015024.1 IS3 family transposase [Staphylococcus epidermidis]MCG1142032.1 IS3 family transposase [Staphylococcus epidermidis]MCG1159976.1 IS3 family transposase [Staphylococcus epidermidis]MCG1185083.1 IS3 family transposase [Staphylococcus epidermidis]MCG1187371.1 IS3 family transposase [Staphylococcus epidermidis]